MATTTVMLNIDEHGVIAALQDATRRVQSAEGEAVLDFSCVRRIDAAALRVLEELARIAEEKAVNVVLRGVNVDIYKALKLVKLTRRFSFVN